MVDINNPLAKHFRQPAIYIKLPSKGMYCPQGVLSFDSKDELAVYAMTARDEMTLNTPDALMNGQATVDVIKSCVPGIKDPWQMPMMDMDTVLIAIRIASFGNSMDMDITVPKVNKQMKFTTDLNALMDSIPKTEFNEYVTLSPQLTVRTRPTNYRQLTNLALRTFEEQRMVAQLAQKDDMKPTEKSDYYTKIFRNMTDLTIENMLNAIVSVNSEGTDVTDIGYIREFVENMHSDHANKIKEHIDSQAINLGKIKPITVQTPEDLVSEGAPAKFEVPISMDNSNFFGSRYSRSTRLN